MKSSNRERVEGTGRQEKTVVQATLGRLTDRPARPSRDDVEHTTGRYQKKTGEIKKVFGR